MKREYEPKTLIQILGYLVEECGEVQAAVGKTLRWGTESINPELEHDDPGYGETNREWVMRELDDLENAITRARKGLREKDLPRAIDRSA